MSDIKELIERLCPDGVEYKKLGDIADITIGEFVHKNKQNPNGKYPVYNGGSSFTGYYDNYNRTGNKIVVSARGAYAGFVNKVYGCYWAGNSSYSIDIISPEVSWHFVYYYLKLKQTFMISKQQKGGGVPAISKKQMQDFEIPVPPIEVQSKIVEIFDNFTELEAELERKLEAELEARRKQYEYYRNQLLSFDDTRSDVKWMTLGRLSEIVTKQTGFDYSKTIKPSLLRSCEGDSIPYMQTKNFSGRTFDYNTDYYVPRHVAEQFPKILLNKQCLLFSIVGASIGNVGLFPGTKECFLGGAICVLKFKEGVNIQYVYEIMSSWYGQRIIKKKTKGSGQATVTVEDIRNFSIPIPPISEQKRIVAILDRFEALTTDLQSGLPAEIEARRKQYEYYREKLLTFKRKTA